MSQEQLAVQTTGIYRKRAHHSLFLENCVAHCGVPVKVGREPPTGAGPPHGQRGEAVPSPVRRSPGSAPYEAVPHPGRTRVPPPPAL
jgi:hypothetical protein